MLLFALGVWRHARQRPVIDTTGDGSAVSNVMSPCQKSFGSPTAAQGACPPGLPDVRHCSPRVSVARQTAGVAVAGPLSLAACAAAGLDGEATRERFRVDPEFVFGEVIDQTASAAYADKENLAVLSTGWIMR